MADSSSKGASGAGLLLLFAIVLGAALGLGLGALVGAPEALAVAGGFIGVFAGFALVYTRFRNV